MRRMEITEGQDAPLSDFTELWKLNQIIEADALGAV